ncbi:MAG: GIY-YIG nuclease family protein [Candidatus Korobacteraceae bacterium]|jgi:predicted GIY-YIG superfamily endonuclease
MPFDKTGSYLTFDETGIAKYAPRSAGVYGIYKGNAWAYIGETNDIEARLYAHLRGESDQSACILRQKPTHYAYETCDNRLAREQALIRELDPACNKA